MGTIDILHNAVAFPQIGAVGVAFDRNKRGGVFY
jgi:hypothetical protein